MMKIQYCYVSKNNLPNGEIAVSGHTASGDLLFGFRTYNSLEIQDKARRYTPSAYIAVFDKCLG